MTLTTADDRETQLSMSTLRKNYYYLQQSVQPSLPLLCYQNVTQHCYDFIVYRGTTHSSEFCVYKVYRAVFSVYNKIKDLC
jgi:hypothetical protein